MLLKKIKLFFFRREWRKKNGHNLTIAANLFPIDIVSVGKLTYGHLEVHTWGAPNEKLVIGNCCSIAWTSKFVLGGNHIFSTFFSYPFKVRVFGQKNEAVSKGPIIVDDDVWIGMNAIILSGVKIGKGAVIGAGAVVAADVEPYAIVGGNPAKFIKYRFNEDIRKKLIATDYSKFNYDNLTAENIQTIYQTVKSDEEINNVIDLLSK